MPPSTQSSAPLTKLASPLSKKAVAAATSSGRAMRPSGIWPTSAARISSLVAAIILLAAGVFWSLWLVRDLMKKRSRAEEALRSEHAFRAAMEDSLTVGMRARDLNGCVIYVNPAFCKMTGFSPEELVGATPPMP